MDCTNAYVEDSSRLSRFSLYSALSVPPAFGFFTVMCGRWSASITSGSIRYTGWYAAGSEYCSLLSFGGLKLISKSSPS